MAEQTLKEKTAKGLFWGGLTNASMQTLNLVFGIFLARLLSPDDYGMVGVLTVFSLVACSIQDSGFTAALANKKNVTDADYNAVFWFNILVSGSIYVILFLCAPLIADFFNDYELISLSRFAFLSILLSSAGTAQNAYLFRNLMVKQKAISNISALAISGGAGVVLAYKGYAYWGLAAQNLIYQGVVSAGYWISSKWRPSLRPDMSPLKGMFGFGFNLLITNIINQMFAYLLNLLLGRFYSKSDVGYYTQASKWTVIGSSFVGGMISSTAQPVLAKVAYDPERQTRVFRKMMRFASFVSFPVMLGLALIAPQFIVIAVTDKWIESAYIMQIICIGAAFTPLQQLCSFLIISKGKSKVTLCITAASVVLSASAILVVKSYGIYSMILAYTLLQVLYLMVWQHFTKICIPLGVIDFIKDILPFFLMAAIVMAATYYVSILMMISNIYALLALKIILAAALYAIGCRIFMPATFGECAEYLKNKLPH